MILNGSFKKNLATLNTNEPNPFITFNAILPNIPTMAIHKSGIIDFPTRISNIHLKTPTMELTRPATILNIDLKGATMVLTRTVKILTRRVIALTPTPITLTSVHKMAPSGTPTIMPIACPMGFRTL